MKLTYDQDKQFEASSGFVSALENLAREYLRMMREADPQYADCWKYCDVVVGDVSNAGFAEFICWGEDSKPEDMTGEVRVRTRELR